MVFFLPRSPFAICSSTNSLLGYSKCPFFVQQLPTCDVFFHHEFNWHRFPQMNFVAEKIWMNNANATIIDPMIPMAYRCATGWQSWSFLSLFYFTLFIFFLIYCCVAHRADGHISTNDCLHYCMPSAIDFVNTLMYNFFIGQAS